MLVAGIETSGQVGSVCLTDDGRLLAEEVFEKGLVHGRELAPALVRVLDLGRRSLSDIELLTVALGPGSYTGIRIGVVFVRVLGRLLGIPTRGVSSLAAWASSVDHDDGHVAVVLDARWDRVYFALFKKTPEGLERAAPDAILTLEEAAHRVPAGSVLLGDGRYPDAFHGISRLDRERIYASAVAEIGTEAFRRHGGDELRPRYLKPWAFPAARGPVGRG
jgi:tRNA threonylcarbamoyladenosine biosynthesis protein TsaB